MNLFESLGRKALFTLDPETAHGLSITALKTGMVPACPVKRDPALGVTLAGLDFPNPLGLAAGYDKNAEVPDAALKLGFGFAEIGTITPRPQSGNPKPRIFRLVEDEGVINRLGFNNEGHAAALARLETRRGRAGIVGVNIGANKDSEDFAADYEKGIETFAHLADYFTANISSPNTPGLRNLQAGEALARLLDRIFARLASQERQPPVFLKVAPDVTNAEIEEIARVAGGAPLSALIVSNTTLSRAGLRNKTQSGEAGGLSGKPLFDRATIVLARFRQALPATMPIIGVGGIDSAETAWAKLEAGASLLQLYSSMIYHGPSLPARIVNGLSDRLASDGASTISAITGRRTAEWVERKLPEETA